jgi:starch phosphorylase
MNGKIHKFTVLPKLPDNLKPLLEIAYNLWWSWNPEAVDLFRLTDQNLWDEVKHNPVKMLGVIGNEKLQKLSEDEAFISHMINVYNSFLMYKEYSTWYSKNLKKELLNIAYFSMEFGLHDSLPIYSGGLGVLSGCHIKSSSDIGIPLIGIGLLYSYGNFNQYLSSDGWQLEKYKENDFSNLPAKLIDGLIVDIPVGNETVYARVWKIDVGRVSIYFLDTNFHKNSLENRKITNYLYVGDRDTRIKQEIVLGIGGMKTLEKLNFCPAICHMNEGHSAFLAIEKFRIVMEKFGINFEEAYELVKNSNVFTTHTPVPAGNEIFEERLIEKYLKPYIEQIGIPYDFIKALGMSEQNFNMTVFALKNSIFANGVSKLHGKVSRKMWHFLWKSLPEEEVPITHVTNGVHIYSWLSDEFTLIFNRYLVPKWHEDPVDKDLWERIDNIPDAEIWRSHLRLKERLISFVRQRLKQQLINRKRPHTEVTVASEVLEPDVLTIGFARRFAEYKRAFLIFKDIDRLKKILNDKNRPVQIIIAGKAHQSDTVGKEIIKNIISVLRQPELRRKIVFLEDYDLNVAKYLVQGVDVWLNTPRRPLEASGTSGMKAAINGVLNLSILDGWWDEAFNGENGWAIGSGEEYGSDYSNQDNIESMMLYDIIENEVVPLYYTTGMDNLPHNWIKKMKGSIKTITPYFNTNRMVQEYTEKIYTPTSENLKKLTADNLSLLKNLVLWKKNILSKWDKVEIKSIVANKKSEIYIGETIEITTKIYLDTLNENDVSVILYYGKLNNKENIVDGKMEAMKFVGKDENSVFTFSTMLKSKMSGVFGYNVRILPKHEGLPNSYIEGLIKIG